MANDDELQAPAFTLKQGPRALLPFVGQVVAIVDGEVKASGTWEEVLRLAQERRLLRPRFLYVPAGRVIGARGG